uniref:Beta-keratin 8 n=1 Tax=Gekko gecko TaxID=36310 RepID=B4X9R1_GEKGE|nr:beta-keratin 8 [Gekko gecko]
MSCCPPSCATPTCPKPCCPSPCCPPCGYPTGGLGKLGCCPSPCGPSSCCGSSTSARCLGLTSGASVSCINQIPPSEVTIQPPPCVVTIPGPVLLPPVSLSVWEGTQPVPAAPLVVASAIKQKGECRKNGNEMAT